MRRHKHTEVSELPILTTPQAEEDAIQTLRPYAISGSGIFLVYFQPAGSRSFHKLEFAFS